jgi:Ca2+-binding RTX toxin-like protein
VFVGGAGVDTVVLGGSVTVDLRLSFAQATGLGMDRFIGVENVTSGHGNDVLIGSALDNRLTAAGGDDLLEGDLGNDTLDGGAGVDTARYSGPAAAKANLALQSAQDTGYGFDVLLGIENLEGGAGDDAFSGNDQANRLVGNGGNDTLTGGRGDDVLKGGAGRNVAVFSGARDEYEVTANGDGSLTVLDTVGQDGADILSGIRFGRFSNGIFALFNADPTDVVLSNRWVVENVAPSTVIGSLSAQDLDGDALAYTLLSNAGGMFALDGADLVLTGALDHETRTQHSISVKVSDAHGGEAIQSFTIHVTNVVEVVREPPPPPLPPSPTPLAVRGTSRADNLAGGAGNDTISGGQGRDVRTGGSGRDAFVFDTKPIARTNVDRIMDFSVTDDTIHLSKSIFSKITKKGVLAGTAFWTGDKAHDANDRIVYNKKTGGLSYDADGTGVGKAVQFAVLDKYLKLAAADFFVV